MEIGKTGHAIEADEATRQTLQEKIKINPNDVDSLVNLGALMFEPYHQPDEAVKLLQAALTKNPKNADAWFWLAKCYFHDFVDSQQAKQALEKALEIEPNRADCLNLMASVLMDLKIAPEKCLRLVERAIELAPDWISLHKNRAMILLKMKHYDEAEAEVQRTFSLISPSPEPKDSVEEYYEEAVTGRRRPNIHKELDDLLQRIREAKSSQSILRKLFR